MLLAKTEFVGFGNNELPVAKIGVDLSIGASLRSISGMVLANKLGTCLKSNLFLQ
mgnify:CR=1 FL=1